MSLSNGRRVGQRQTHAKAYEQQAGNAVEPMHAALHRADTAHQPGRRQRPQRIDRNGVGGEQHP